MADTKKSPLVGVIVVVVLFALWVIIALYICKHEGVTNANHDSTHPDVQG